MSRTGHFPSSNPYTLTKDDSLTEGFALLAYNDPDGDWTAVKDHGVI
jgi:hypothetical protein